MTEDYFNDFIKRLKYHNIGDGVDDHCTANPIFNVMKRRIISGIDFDYTDNRLIYSLDDTDYYFRSYQEFYNNLDEQDKLKLDKLSQVWSRDVFLNLNDNDKIYVIGRFDEDLNVVGFEEEWEYVNSHLTREGAEDFIKACKNKENYEIHVESLCKCKEFNMIIEALLQGKLVYKS
jgi:hypothetical protein